MTEKPKRQNVVRDEHGLTPAERRMWQGMLRIASPSGLIRLASRQLCLQTGVSLGRYNAMLAAIKGARLLQVARPGGPQRAVVLRVFASPQATFPELPELPAPEALRPPPRKTSSAPRAEPRAAPVTPVERHKPRPVQVKRDRKGAVLNPWVMGTAHAFDIGTPAQRIAALDEAERARIAAQYGARF